MSGAKVVAVDGASQIRTGLSQAGAHSATQSECLQPGGENIAAVIVGLRKPPTEAMIRSRRSFRRA
jgi:hypothetical protein